MTATTISEKKIVLTLGKNFLQSYNASEISKTIKTTRVGAFKSLKKLEKENIVLGKLYGKSKFYTLNLTDDYSTINFITLLMEESKNFEKWKNEFQELAKFTSVLILFGSITKNEHIANDIDLLLIFEKNNNSQINKIINEKNELLIKKIHPIKQTKDDIIKNIENNDKIIIDAIKNGIVLHGFKEYVKIIKNVAIKK